ncbi:patatin-like phospholipase family protein, partial [Burkholderia cenocepacia]
RVPALPGDALDRSPGYVLVLVARLHPRPQLFTVARGDQRRLYVRPSSKVPISSWDYTSPSQMRHAYDLGRRDGAHFLARVGAMTGGRVAA